MAVADVLARSRMLVDLCRDDEAEPLLAQVLAQEPDNEGVSVLGATNRPWDVDSALRRPGRFDRTVLVLPPDASARAWPLVVAGALVGEVDEAVADRPGADEAQRPALADLAEQALPGPEHHGKDDQPQFVD